MPTNYADIAALNAAAPLDENDTYKVGVRDAAGTYSTVVKNGITYAVGNTDRWWSLIRISSTAAEESRYSHKTTRLISASFLRPECPLDDQALAAIPAGSKPGEAFDYETPRWVSSGGDEGSVFTWILAQNGSTLKMQRIEEKGLYYYDTNLTKDDVYPHFKWMYSDVVGATAAGWACIADGSKIIQYNSPLAGMAEYVDSALRSAHTFDNVAGVFEDTVNTYGNTTAGKILSVRTGGAYEVLDAASEYHFLTTAGGLKVKPIPKHGIVSAGQFNVEDNVESTAKIQALIDYCMYGKDVNKCIGAITMLDVRRISASNTIHIGYGLDARGHTVKGIGIPYAGTATSSTGTVINTSVTDRPAINIQGARITKLSDFAIEGPAQTAIKALNEHARTFTDEAVWDAALLVGGITPSRYAPCAGVVIDGYSGTVESETYPSVTYPAYLGESITQYGKSQSSTIKVNDLSIRGFEVGLVCRPGNLQSNGDFFDLSRLIIDSCKYAISVGNSQARNTQLSGGIYTNVHTAIVNNKHGNQDGRIDTNVTNQSFGESYQIFELRAGTVGGQLVLDSMYAESTFRLGVLTGLGSALTTTVTLKNSTIKLASMTDECLDGWLIDMGNDHVVLDSTDFIAPRVVAIGKGSVDINICSVDLTDAPAKPYEALGLNCLSGGITLSPKNNKEIKTKMVAYSATDASAVGSGITGKEYSLTGRDTCIPYASRSGKAETSGSFNDKIIHSTSLSAGNRTSVSRVDRSITFTNAALTNVDKAYKESYLPGCVMVDDASGTVMLVRSTDTGTGVTTVEMQNNYYFDGTNYQIYRNFDPAVGTWYCISGLIYCPASVLWGDFTSGSNVITNVRDVNGGGVATNFGLNIGDRLAMPCYEDVLITGSAGLEITAIDTTAKTITLAGNALHSKHMKLPYWYRTPPANEGSR